MKRIWVLVFVMLLFLWGCSEKPNITEPSNESTVETIPSVSETTVRVVEGDLGLLEPNAALEALGLRRYPLSGTDHYAVRPMGDGILLLSGSDETTLTYLRDDRAPVSVTLTDILLSVDDASWTIGKKGIIYYDEIYNEMVELDDQFREVRRLPMPVDMGHAPAFSSDMEHAYYFDRKGKLRALDLESGISRLLADEKTGDPYIRTMHFGDSLLECVICVEGVSEYLMIDAATGTTLFRTSNALELDTSEDWYFVPWKEGHATELVFGERAGERSCFSPQIRSDAFPLASHRSVVCLSDTGDGCQLRLYDLSGSSSVSTITLPGYGILDLTMDDRLDWVWVLGEAQDGSQVLYGWDPSVVARGSQDPYVTPYYTVDFPDTAGLERIAQEAKALGDRFGVKVLVYRSAAETHPSGYMFEAEYLVSAYDHYLELLEQQLERYPVSMMKKLGKSSGNGRLTISLVRTISGDGELGGLSATDGTQYWKAGDAYLTLAMGQNFVRSFHHELFHAIDTYVLAETKAYDFWDSMNPEGFSYDNDYVKNSFRDPEQYVTGEDRAFVDTYSMSFPKEDRARIMEYAVMEGQEEVFSSNTMQKKLKTLCRGIRSAFGLSNVSEALLWEQYLDAS